MATKIRLSTEVTEALETVKPGDVVQSINHKGVILVTETNDNGTYFNGMILDRGNHPHWVEKNYGVRLAASHFRRYIGSVTLKSF